MSKSPGKSQLQKRAERSLQAMTAGQWGLGRCRPDLDCQVCEVHGEDSFSLRQLRNLYVSGFPGGSIPSMLDPDTPLTGRDIHSHAFRQNWAGQRKKLNAFDVTEESLLLMMFSRAQQAKPVVNANSHDKMLEMIMKLKGYGQQNIKVEGSIDVTWEKIVTQGKDKDATITLPDEAFAEIGEIEEHAADD